jgi:hypothetical protein
VQSVFDVQALEVNPLQLRTVPYGEPAALQSRTELQETPLSTPFKLSLRPQ